MKEPARLARNAQRLTQMDPGTAAAVRRVLGRLEARGFRPRIQEGWRSPARQLELFHSGFSQVRFGFHNVVGPGGVPQALACDVLDDDAPLAPRRRYLLALAVAARAERLETGIAWSLSAPLRAGVEAAIAAGDIDRPVKVGWDPTHVQPTGLTIAQARAGRRPVLTGTAATASGTAAAPTVHVVRRGETLTGIARHAGTTLARLLQLNPHKATNPNLITVGERIRVA
jgi:hypothetical protein